MTVSSRSLHFDPEPRTGVNPSSPEDGGSSPPDKREGGFTVIELLAVLAIVGILLTMAVPEILSALEEAKYSTATLDLETYTKKVMRYRARNGKLPDDWGDLGYTSTPKDPWGNQYVYNNHNLITPGDRRKDGPTVPINSHFDIFSPGPNGDWSSTIQTQKSHDDVIVAEDGQYIGKAEDY